MSDEEKEALEILNNTEWDGFMITIKNLFEKQQKEIEELKEKNKTLKNLQNDTNRLYTEMIERKNYFERELQKLEDKIKAKIEEYKKQLDLDYVDKHFVPIERYNQLEKEIEELKKNKGYHLGFIDGGIAKRYEMEDKIKAKIEKLDYNDIGNFERRCKQEVLQSLLEKE